MCSVCRAKKSLWLNGNKGSAGSSSVGGIKEMYECIGTMIYKVCPFLKFVIPMNKVNSLLLLFLLLLESEQCYLSSMSRPKKKKVSRSLGRSIISITSLYKVALYMELWSWEDVLCYTIKIFKNTKQLHICYTFCLCCLLHKFQTYLFITLSFSQVKSEEN